MIEKMNSYWEVIEPLFSAINFGDGLQEFNNSIASIPRSSVILFSAHMCLAEVHNGGFLQLFWNSTGLLVPEGIEGFSAIGMPTMTRILREAASHLGSPYPRDRDDRWDALLSASNYNARELKKIFKQHDNLYLAFKEAVQMLPFDSLDKQFVVTAESENSGFQDAATRFAQAPFLIQ